MPLDAGRLRHRVTIQERKSVQDPQTGTTTPKWVTVWENVPAAIEPLSVSGFIASQAVQSQVTARVVIRYRDGLTADMRIVHAARNKIYNPQGWLPDPGSGLEYVTAPCTEGVNDGQ